jgi:hypothetical protein
MSCGCGNCKCEALQDRIDILEAQIALLVALDEKRHDAEKQFGRQLVEARGRIAERKL